PVLLKKIEEKSADEAGQGKLDAETGHVSPEMSAKSRSYADAAVFTEHQSAGLNAVADAKVLASTPSSQQATLSDGSQAKGWGGLGMLDTRDAEGNLVPGLSTTMDNFFRGRLG